MPDIAMCRNKNCNKKETCYRYKATPFMHQTYFLPDPQEESCVYYWKIKLGDIK